jgi:creatinase
MLKKTSKSLLNAPARADFFRFHNGEKAALPFSSKEYARRLKGLRAIMSRMDVPAVLLTSMHNIAYYSGFLYCSFGRPYACVVTHDKCITISANIDAGQPWRRSVDDNITYTDWQRDNYWRAVKEAAGSPSRIGVEADHMTLAMRDKAAAFLGCPDIVDFGKETMVQRMVKSAEEISLIKSGAKVADIGGYAIRDAIKVGAREIDIAMAGRDAMELAIAERHPDSEIRDSWVWFQSGLNTDGAHNPVTTRKLVKGDILSLNTFPMISGYYTALERTLFIGEPSKAERKLWEINVGAHELGISLIKPGATCSGITAEVNRYFEDHNVLQYRTFGYGHSFGILSHYYGREAGLELREDIDTVLEPGMVVSMEPMLTVPEGKPGAGGYREHDILVIGKSGAENITGFPYGPEHNIVSA